MVGERGFEPPTPWSRKRNSGVVLNVFNLLQWCFNRLIPAQSPHSGVNVSPRMEVPRQGFISRFLTPWDRPRDSGPKETNRGCRDASLSEIGIPVGNRRWHLVAERNA